MPNHKLRLNDFNMTGFAIASALSGTPETGCNPGALRVCLDLMVKGEGIDPDAALGGFAPMFALDMQGVYESRIWMLYKDVCGQSYEKMIGALRAVQLGFVSDAVFNHAIDNRGAGMNLDEALQAVKNRLPKIQIPGFEAQPDKGSIGGAPLSTEQISTETIVENASGAVQGVSHVIKKFGTGLTSPAGSSFGGMTQAKKDVDAFLTTDGDWTEDIAKAHKFGMRVAAENRLALLPQAPGRYAIEED